MHKLDKCFDLYFLTIMLKYGELLFGGPQFKFTVNEQRTFYLFLQLLPPPLLWIKRFSCVEFEIFYFAVIFAILLPINVTQIIYCLKNALINGWSAFCFTKNIILSTIVYAVVTLCFAVKIIEDCWKYFTHLRGIEHANRSGITKVDLMQSSLTKIEFSVHLYPKYYYWTFYV